MGIPRLNFQQIPSFSPGNLSPRTRQEMRDTLDKSQRISTLLIEHRNAPPDSDRKRELSRLLGNSQLLAQYLARPQD